MKFHPLRTTLLCVSIISFLFLSCKPSTSVETATDNVEKPAYKDAVMIGVEDFEKGMKKNKAFLLDVRQPQEFEQGHIEGAVNINFFDPTFKSQLLGLDKNRKYYMYCKNDVRSERAAEFLLQNDYEEVYVLKGGYEAWIAAGKK